MAEVAGSNPAEPIVLFGIRGENTAEDNENEELPTSTEDGEMEKESTDEQTRRKEWQDVVRSIQVTVRPTQKVTNALEYAAELLREEREAYLRNVGRENHNSHAVKAEKNSNELRFSKSDLNDFVSHRKVGLAKKSMDWIDRASKLLWESTKGEVSSRTLTVLRQMVREKYNSVDSHSKVLGFATRFLSFSRRRARNHVITPLLRI